MKYINPFLDFERLCHVFTSASTNR